MVASAQKADTTRTKHLGEAQVVTNRATNKTPLAFSNLDKKAIEKVNFGQDIPFLLSTLPNVVTTSDAGTGIGYTSLRVRGTVGERINVTNNGIPLNDPEAHTFYWVDTPDLVSSVNDIQLQRGVGTSTNGAAAFGASVNMTTDRLSASPYALYAGSFGSFNTTKNTVKAGTGLFANHWTFDARLSYLSSEGYRDRSSARLGSYFAQLAYINEGTTLKLIAFVVRSAPTMRGMVSAVSSSRPTAPTTLTDTSRRQSLSTIIRLTTISNSTLKLCSRSASTSIGISTLLCTTPMALVTTKNTKTTRN